MNWIPYVAMARWAKENLPGGSLKYLYILKFVYFNVVTGCILYINLYIKWEDLLGYNLNGVQLTNQLG